MHREKGSPENKAAKGWYSIWIVEKLVLRNSSKLHDDSNPVLVKKVFIPPNLTPKEQAENKILRVETGWTQ